MLKHLILESIGYMILKKTEVSTLASSTFVLIYGLASQEHRPYLEMNNHKPTQVYMEIFGHNQSPGGAPFITCTSLRECT